MLHLWFSETENVSTDVAATEENIEYIELRPFCSFVSPLRGKYIELKSRIAKRSKQLSYDITFK